VNNLLSRSVSGFAVFFVPFALVTESFAFGAPPVESPAPAAQQAAPQAAAAPRAFAIDDLYSLRRVSDPQVSPDGKWIAYSVASVSLEKNASTSHVWLVSSDGSRSVQLTNHAKGETRPRWSPDGKTIAFISARDGTPQVWNIALDGGEARQVTRVSTGADNHVWCPQGKHLAFTSDVWPGLKGGDAEQKKRSEEIESSGVKAQVLDALLYRHWSEWRRGKRSHVFVVAAEGGEAHDVTPGEFDAPPFSLGGPDPVDISPDGKELAYTRGPDRAVEAWSTNSDIFVVPIGGGDAVNLTAENKGADASPVWSPDGKYIAYRSQARDGYESDKVRLAVVERATGKIVYLAADVDRSVDQLVWRPEGEAIYFIAEAAGRTSLYSVPIRGLAQPAPAAPILSGMHLTGISLPADSSFIVGELQSLTRPVEVVRLNVAEALQGKAAPLTLTHENDATYAQLQMPSVESVTYAGALGAQVQAWLLKPPGWQKDVRYPLVVFIHGGPQGAWNDGFSFRWNAALYATRGFVVLLPNPHGSTGFGQSYTEQISGDWGGACYEDLMKGVDWAVAQGLADPDHMAAMGGSFGGYMVNWILGHTDRFKALVSHAGVYNLESMYGVTEELWFPEWDLKGTPWKHDGPYEKYSPHRFAANFKTPTLVIHGELDFRVPVGEGMQLFTALQRRGIESKFLYFPDEGHWVLKPKNSKLWNETVIAWLEKFLKPAPPK
jgi:dipeptidyl aminopeptidase/acylaminoacyl peptidase